MEWDDREPTNYVLTWTFLVRTRFSNASGNSSLDITFGQFFGQYFSLCVFTNTVVLPYFNGNRLALTSLLFLCKVLDNLSLLNMWLVGPAIDNQRFKLG